MDFTDEEERRGADALNLASNGGIYDPLLHARAVLAAVLPEYTARVRAEVLREAADAMDIDIVDAHGPHAQGWNDGVRHVQITVRARADALEGL